MKQFVRQNSNTKPNFFKLNVILVIKLFVRQNSTTKSVICFMITVFSNTKLLKSGTWKSYIKTSFHGIVTKNEKKKLNLW